MSQKVCKQCGQPVADAPAAPPVYAGEPVGKGMWVAMLYFDAPDSEDAIG